MKITIEQDDFSVSLGSKESNKQTDNDTLFYALNLLSEDLTDNFSDLQTEYAVIEYMGCGSSSDLFRDLGTKLDCFRQYLDLTDSDIWDDDVVDRFYDFLAKFFPDKDCLKNLLKFYDWENKEKKRKEKEQDKLDEDQK